MIVAATQQLGSGTQYARATVVVIFGSRRYIHVVALWIVMMMTILMHDRFPSPCNLNHGLSTVHRLIRSWMVITSFPVKHNGMMAMLYGSFLPDTLYCAME